LEEKKQPEFHIRNKSRGIVRIGGKKKKEEEEEPALPVLIRKKEKGRV